MGCSMAAAGTRPPCAPAPARTTRRRANAGAAAAALALWTGQARAEDRFAFDTPEGWSVEEKRDGETLAVAEDEARALRVVVERAQWPEALEAVARRARDEAVTAEDVARAITAPSGILTHQYFKSRALAQTSRWFHADGGASLHCARAALVFRLS